MSEKINRQYILIKDLTYDKLKNEKGRHLYYL